MKELILTKTAYVQNYNSLLTEKIANKVNQKIATTLKTGIDDLKNENTSLKTGANAKTVSAGVSGAVSTAQQSLNAGNKFISPRLIVGIVGEGIEETKSP